MRFPGKRQCGIWIKTKIEQRCKGTMGRWLAVITLWGWEDQTGGPVWLFLQLLVNSQTHSPVAVYCGGKPCEFHPKKHKFHCWPFFFVSFFPLKRTHTRTAPSLFLLTTLHPPAILQGSSWISGGEQLQIGISCARLAESRGRKKS